MKSVAVVGTGYWGKNLVRNFHSLGALQAVCDTSEPALAAMGKLYPDVRMETSFAAILADSEIAGIAIATPAPLHASMIRQALLAGKDVYVEKPLCLSEKEGQELNALAQEKNKVLMVGHLLWFHTAVIKLQELIKDGQLGRIQYIYSNRLNLGKLRREENVLWSFAPHDISIILGLVEEMPDSVYAQGGNFLHQHIADTTTSLFSFPSGIQAHIFVSWLHPFKEQKLVVVGERQMAVFDDQAPWPEKLQLYQHSIEWSGSVPVANKAQGTYVKITKKEPLHEECAHFLDCMESRRSPKTDGAEGLRVLKVLNACQRSMELGKKIELTPPANLQKNYFIHDSAVVDNNVEVGEKSKIWHLSHLLSGVRVGKSCNIGQNVVIGPNVTIGNGCKIQNNISIYEGVTLEDEVFCGPSMVFTNVMNPRAAISRKDEFRPTLVKKGATLGANSTIVTGVTIGRYSFVGAGAVVIAPVPDFALVVGNPARQIGWMSRHGERLDLPLDGSPTETVCPVTGDYYRFEKGKVTLMRTESP